MIVNLAFSLGRRQTIWKWLSTEMDCERFLLKTSFVLVHM